MAWKRRVRARSGLVPDLVVFALGARRGSLRRSVSPAAAGRTPNAGDSGSGGHGSDHRRETGAAQGVRHRRPRERPSGGVARGVPLGRAAAQHGGHGPRVGARDSRRGDRCRRGQVLQRRDTRLNGATRDGDGGGGRPGRYRGLGGGESSAAARCGPARLGCARASDDGSEHRARGRRVQRGQERGGLGGVTERCPDRVPEIHLAHR